MKRQLLILALVISALLMACTHDPASNSTDTSNLGGGSAVLKDSLKTVGTSPTGQTPNSTGTDTVINGHLVSADSAKKIKP